MPGVNSTVALSQDGTRMVYPVRSAAGTPQLAIRRLDQKQDTLLAGTEEAADPFFSPDGEWVGFFANGQLKKVSIQGGTPISLCAAPGGVGASWGKDGNIILGGGLSGLSIVSGAGGVPQPLTKLAHSDTTHRWPQILPGDDVVIFTASPTLFGQDDASIEAVELKTGKVSILHRGGYFGRYLPSGHLVYIHQGVLFGVPFDPVHLRLKGKPEPVLEDISGTGRGGGQFDFSAGPDGHGTFVYVAGQGASQTWPIVWLDGAGNTRPLVAKPGVYNNVRLSPSGRRLAVQSSIGGANDVFVYDLARDIMTRLTFTGQATVSVWTPDEQHLVFRSASNSGTKLSWIRSDGSGEVQDLLVSNTPVTPFSFSPDGRRLAYYNTAPGTGQDLWTLPLDVTDPDHPKPGKPELFLATPANELLPAFSPDGHWIAYVSTESGRGEIYVRPFPSRGGKWQISTDGGALPIWSNNRRELFYKTSSDRIMALDYAIVGDSFQPGKARLWGDGRSIFNPGTVNISLAPDGNRFAVFSLPQRTVHEEARFSVTFLLNFFDELRKRMPGGT